MSELNLWLMYLLIMIVLAIVAFGISDKSRSVAKVIKNIASFCLVAVGITFITLTVVLALEHVLPKSNGSDNYVESNVDEEQCVPDQFGGC